MTPVWALYVMAGLGATIGAFDPPARQALVPMLVPREHLPNAISLNTIMVQAASVAGPAIGGLLIGSVGLKWVYLANALSFGCVIAALLMMRDVPERTDAAADGNDVSFRSALEGLRFVFGSPLIRSTMLLDFFATFFSSAIALLPIFAQDILLVGPQGYGWLYAAPATGALTMSAAMVLLTERIVRRGPVLLWAVALYGLATIAVRLLAVVLADIRLSCRDRRSRHRQHGHPQHRPPAGDTRPAARTHHRDQHGVLQWRTAAGRDRGRAGGELGWSAAVRHHRRYRLSDRDGVGCGNDA